MKHSKGKEVKDSESDWDSMTEARPSTRSEKEESSKLNEESDENESSIKSQQNSVKNEYQKEDDNPPYSFKSEVRSPAKKKIDEKPGKSNKGRTYEPLVKDNIRHKKKYPNFPDEHVSSDSENEEVKNVMYQSLQRSNILPPLRQKRSPAERGKNIALGPTNLKSSSKISENDGASNQGYETDEEILYDKIPVTTNGIVIGSADYHLDGFPMNTRGKLNTERKRSLIQVTETDATIQIFNHSSLQNVNKHLEKGFNYAAFPLVCFFLFFHHLLRFLILHLMKPLILDTISICSAYFVRPLFANVFHPFCQNIHLATLSLSQIFLNVLRPLISILKSCRLVEINHKDRRDPSPV